MLWRKLWAVLLVLALVGVPMAGAVEESEAEEQAAPEVTYDPAAGSGGDPMPDSTAKAVLVMDAGSGTVLWEKNAHEVLEPASVTKIMTMLLVCEAVDAGLITPDTMVTTSAHAAGMGGSQVYLEEGEQMSVDDLLKAVAVSSGNDAAVALGEAVAGSESAFVERMNRRAEELLDEQHPDFNPLVDPKCSWALAHLDFFPVEVNTADYEALLRVPGIGVTSARRILTARRSGRLRVEDLRKMGVVMKRAQYFLTASGRRAEGLLFTPDSLLRNLIAAERPLLPEAEPVQLSLFDSPAPV